MQGTFQFCLIEGCMYIFWTFFFNWAFAPKNIFLWNVEKIIFLWNVEEKNKYIFSGK